MKTSNVGKLNIPDILIERITEDTNRYIDWLQGIDVIIDKGLLLAGPFQSPEYPLWPRTHDNFHYPLGMHKLLALGFSGIKEAALRNACNLEGNQREYLLLINRVYDSIINVIKRYSDVAKEKGKHKISRICNALSQRTPDSFPEACQLYWFSTLFRIGTATIGRMDQHLYPYYKADLQKGLINLKTAKKIIGELLLRFEKRGDAKGDTLQNITLSGMNALGEDQTNELTYMILELCIHNKYIEPKINIRLNKNSPENLLSLISELQMKGTGICTIFNDDAIIEGLMQYGRPADIAANYCADGCSEIILDGVGETAFRYVDCVKAVEHILFNGEENVPEKKRLQYYTVNQDCVDIQPPFKNGLKTGDFLDVDSFESFYDAYLSQLKYQVAEALKVPYNSDQNPMRLFTAATMPGVLENGCDPYINHECYHTYGLFIGSLGTAANSLAAIRYLVYEKKLVSKEDLLTALHDNFEKQPAIRQLCLDAPKYGNDDDYADQIAVDIAKKYASWVRTYEDRTGKPILPGLYNHLFHHTAYNVGATPDGRRFGDPVGEHLSPTPGTALKGPTAVINSYCKINTSEQIFGSTLHLNIPLISLKDTPNPKEILIYLNKAFCLKKGCVLNINVLDSEVLLDAQKNPDKYKDLVVRVWGFSYYFIYLSKELQDHVIARSQAI